MKNRNVKRLVCSLTAAICIAATSLPIFADTVGYDITIPGDTISKRVIKAGGELHENKFYVSGHSFSNSATLICQSHKLDIPSFKSYEASISSNVTSSRAGYRSYAAPNIYYYMSSRAVVSNLHIKGNYTQ